MPTLSGRATLVTLSQDAIQVYGIMAGSGGFMQSSDLMAEQWRQMDDTIGRQCDYLNRLVERMKEQGFPPDDRLLAKADNAHRYMRGLYGETQPARWAIGKENARPPQSTTGLRKDRPFGRGSERAPSVEAVMVD